MHKRTSTWHGWLGVAIAVAAAPTLARAQNFPPDSAWVPLRCGNGVMTDPYRDDPAALNERDLVGDGGAAAGFRAADAQFVYLRVRVDDDPAPGGSLRPSVWGFAFDTDGNLQSYEILATASGVSRMVSIFRNSAVTIANSPADPADTPPVASFPFASHALTVGASGSRFGNTPDFFVELALPWSVLESLGLHPQSSVRLWAGSSGSANALDGDIACQDARSGPATLSASASDPTTLGGGGGGTGGTGGGGGLVGPVGQNGLEFEGGPGCSCRAAGGSAIGAGPGPLVIMLAFALRCLRRGGRKLLQKDRRAPRRVRSGAWYVSGWPKAALGRATAPSVVLRCASSAMRPFTMGNVASRV